MLNNGGLNTGCLQKRATKWVYMGLFPSDGNVISSPAFLWCKQQLTLLIDFLCPLRTIEAGPRLLYDFPLYEAWVDYAFKKPLIKTEQTELSAERMENSEAVVEGFSPSLWHSASPIAWDRDEEDIRQITRAKWGAHEKLSLESSTRGMKKLFSYS